MSAKLYGDDRRRDREKRASMMYPIPARTYTIYTHAVVYIDLHTFREETRRELMVIDAGRKTWALDQD